MEEIYIMWFPAVVGDWAFIQDIPSGLNFLKRDCGLYSCLFMAGFLFCFGLAFFFN